MSGHHLATVRRAGRKRGARFESSEALAEQPAVRRSAVELHGCCARVSLAEALLSQHIDGVARASSAGTKSRSIARSLVLLTMLAPVSRTARLGDQLGLDDEANSQIADGGATGSRLPGGTSVGDLPTSSASAVQLILELVGSAPTPPVHMCSSETMRFRVYFTRRVIAFLHTQKTSTAQVETADVVVQQTDSKESPL